MIMQPIRAQSLTCVAMLHANEPSQNIREPLQTVRKAEEKFFASYHGKFNT